MFWLKGCVGSGFHSRALRVRRIIRLGIERVSSAERQLKMFADGDLTDIGFDDTDDI